MAYESVKKDETARAAASRLLTNVNVKKYIDEQLQKIESKKIAEATEVMQYLTSVMRGETSAEVVVVEFQGDGYSRAKRMDKAPDEKERLKAAELLGKRYGLFTDKVNLDADSELTIHIDYGDDAE